MRNWLTLFEDTTQLPALPPVGQTPFWIKPLTPLTKKLVDGGDWSWTNGGCFAFAEAFHEVFGGEPWGICSEFEEEGDFDYPVEHAMVKVGNQFFDFNGVVDFEEYAQRLAASTGRKIRLKAASEAGVFWFEDEYLDDEDMVFLRKVLSGQTPLKEEVIEEGTNVSEMDIKARKIAKKTMRDLANGIWEKAYKKWELANPDFDNSESEAPHHAYDELVRIVRDDPETYTILAADALHESLTQLVRDQVLVKFGPQIHLKNGTIINNTSPAAFFKIREFSSDEMKDKSGGYFRAGMYPSIVTFANASDVTTMIDKYISEAAHGEMYDREDTLPIIMRTFIHEYAHLEQWLLGAAATSNDAGYIKVKGGKHGNRRSPEKGNAERLRYYGSHLEIDSFASDTASEIIQNMKEGRYNHEVSDYDIKTVLTDIAAGYGGSSSRSMERYSELKYSTFQGEFEEIGLDPSEMQKAYQRFLKSVYQKLWQYSKEKIGKSAVNLNHEMIWKDWAEDGLVKCTAKIAEQIGSYMAFTAMEWENPDDLFQYMPEEFSKANRFIEHYFFGDEMDWEKSKTLSDKFKAIVRSYFDRYQRIHGRKAA
jgi:hypothetical protein